jgi:hypothetical protein
MSLIVHTVPGGPTVISLPGKIGALKNKIYFPVIFYNENNIRLIPVWQGG